MTRFFQNFLGFNYRRNFLNLWPPAGLWVPPLHWWAFLKRCLASILLHHVRYLRPSKLRRLRQVHPRERHNLQITLPSYPFRKTQPTFVRCRFPCFPVVIVNLYHQWFLGHNVYTIGYIMRYSRTSIRFYYLFQCDVEPCICTCSRHGCSAAACLWGPVSRKLTCNTNSINII